MLELNLRKTSLLFLCHCEPKLGMKEQRILWVNSKQAKQYPWFTLLRIQ